jgi:hypothetical protein
MWVLSGFLVVFLANGETVQPSPNRATLSETRAEAAIDYALLSGELRGLALQMDTLRAFCNVRIGEPALTARKSYCSAKNQELLNRSVDVRSQADKVAIRLRSIDDQLRSQPGR